MIRLLSVALITLMMLTGCGGSDENVFVTAGTTTGGDEIVNVGSIYLTSSSLELPSAGLDPVTITAFVRDSQNRAMEDVAVGFSADSNATLALVRPITDATGSAVAELNTTGDKSNRTITVSVNAGGVTEQITIDVVGTKINIDAPTSGTAGDRVDMNLSLRDSNNTGIASTEIALATNSGGDFTNPAPLTDTSGNATTGFTPTSGGNVTISASALGAVSNHIISVSDEEFSYIAPLRDPREEVVLNTPKTITVELLSAGVAVAGELISFSATRGTITGSPAVTDANGRASVTIQANTAGPSVISATAYKGTTREATIQVEILFIATVPVSISLQSSPSTLGVLESSAIMAVVRDANGNLVKNQRVNFEVTADVTGGSISADNRITDEFGTASITYTAGNSSSARDAIKITATVDGTGIYETVSLTVGEVALFITLGGGRDIKLAGDTRYDYPYSVLVTDANGAPVKADVDLMLWPKSYAKGRYNYTADGWVWDPAVVGCQNEDINRNGILDAGEDSNNDGRLTPGIVATLTSSTVRTDDSGFAEFSIQYQKEYAHWVVVELTARAVVGGSESTAVREFRLPILAADQKDEAGPAGNPSPFGISALCSDAL